MRWPHFDVYSVKFAYRPIGQRGYPLKVFVHRIFIDIASKNATASSCTNWFRSVGVSSAMPVKKLKFRSLCIKFDQFAAEGALEVQNAISSHFRPVGASSIVIAMKNV